MPETPSNYGDEKEGKARYETPAYWANWIKENKKQAKEQHWDDAECAWDEYLAEADGWGKDAYETPKRYPIFWSSIQSLLPAYYSETPIASASRRFDSNDPVAGTACLVAERLDEALSDADGGSFDEAMAYCALDFILADKAKARVIFEEFEEAQTQRIEVSASDDGQGNTVYYDDKGVYEGDVFEDDEGFYYEAEAPALVRKKISVLAVPFDGWLHNADARCNEEIVDEAYEVTLTEDEARERFKGIDNLPLLSAVDKDGREQDKVEKHFKYWEIWCSKNRMMYCVCPELAQEFLEEPEEDPYQLNGFFPSTKCIIGTQRRKSLFPRPAHVYLRGTLKMLNTLYHRLWELLDAARHRAIIDGGNPEIEKLLQSGNDRYVVVQNLAQILEKGGLESLVHFFPLGELAALITGINENEDKIRQLFYEFFGMPDIIRGASDPQETATAQGIKTKSATHRFTYRARQLAQLASDLKQLRLDLALRVYDDAELSELAGFQYMDAEDQQRFPSAINLLRNDNSRMIRLKVETDQTSAFNRQVKQGEQRAAADAAVNGLSQIASVAGTAPEFVPAMLKILMGTLSTLDMGREYEDETRGAIEQLMASKNQPAGPPPPDYEGMKLQIENQKLMLKNQELSHKQQKDYADYQLKQMEFQLKSQMASVANWAEQVRVQLESKGVQIDEFKAEQIAWEGQAEEQRMMIEANARMVEAYKPHPQEAPGAVIVNQGAPAAPPLVVPQPMMVDRMVPMPVDRPMPFPVKEPLIVPVKQPFPVPVQTQPRGIF